MKLFLLGAGLLVCMLVAQSTGLAASAKAVRKGKLAHVVAFKFKPTATQAEIDHLVNEFRALPGKIKQIHTFEWGTNVSPEQHDKGFTHLFTLTFKSDKDRDEYLVHPDHKAFGKIVGPVVADVFVIDYWAGK